jgi:hypothetical protein
MESNRRLKDLDTPAGDEIENEAEVPQNEEPDKEGDEPVAECSKMMCKRFPEEEEQENYSQDEAQYEHMPEDS